MKSNILYYTKSIFQYAGDIKFDLINQPDEKVDYGLFVDYNNFLKNIETIYGTQRDDGTIPVFWTKQNDSSSLSRIADPYSTLKYLEPNESYYIILSNNDCLPLKIPQQTNSKDFLENNNFANKENINIFNDLSSIVIKNNEDLTINLTKSSGYDHELNIKIDGLIPNENYSYSISPIFSNWPSNLSSFSGLIDRSGPVNDGGFVSSTIKSYFKYASCPYLSECTSNIPYSLIDITNNSYTHNIYTLLNLKIYKDNKLTLSDTITITCDDCINRQKKPTIKTNTKNIVLNNQYYTMINIEYDYLDPNRPYQYSIKGAGSNWPSRIDKDTDTIKHTDFKVEDGNTYSYGSIEILFAYALSANNLPQDWSNISYNLENYYPENFMKNNIYTRLNISLEDLVNNNIVSNTLTIKCNNCLPHIPNCVDDLVISLPYSPPTPTYYPFLSYSRRPSAETNLDLYCCDFDQHILVNISGACSGELYNYTIDSYPTIKIVPQTGQFSFTSGFGTFSALANLSNLESSVIQVVATHKNSGKSVSDSMILRCSGL